MLTFAQFLKVKWPTFLIYVLIFLALALGFSLLKPLQYQANSQILIIHRLLPNLDAYSAARASEKLAQNLAEIVTTASFLETLAESQKINPEAFLPGDERQQRNEWNNKVSARVNNSILEITTYDAQPVNAVYLNNAIIQTLLEQGDQFHGGGENIRLKIINEPLSSRWPAKPNFPINLLLGLIMGWLVAYWRVTAGYKKIYPASHKHY